MIFRSRIYEDIVTEGAVLVKTERNFGYFGNCNTKIYLADKPVFSFEISGLSDRFSMLKNRFDFLCEIISRNEAVSERDHYRLKITSKIQHA